MRSRAFALLLLVSLLAGCAGSDGGTDHADQPSRGAGLGQGVPAGTGPAEEEAPSGQWLSHGFDGDFTTTLVVDIGSYVAGAPDVVTVPAGASFAWFNGTVETPIPDGLTVRLDAPGCEAQACSVEGQLEAGAFSLGGYGPAAGDWSIRFFAQSAAQSGSYHVDVNAFVL